MIDEKANNWGEKEKHENERALVIDVIGNGYWNEAMGWSTTTNLCFSKWFCTGATINEPRF